MNPYFADQPETTVAQSTQPTPELAPVAPAPKKSKKKLIIIAGSALLLLIVAGVLFLVLGRGSSGAYADSLPYVYAKQQLNIDPTTKFEFTAKYNVEELESYKSGKLLDNLYSDAVSIYTDEALTKPAADAQVNFSGEYSSKQDTITVQPSRVKVNAVGGSGVSGVGTDGIPVRTQGWGMFEQYYIVQKLDENGEKLAKPIVTRFTAKPATELSTPKISFAVDADGIAHLNWQKVEGATKYHIIRTTNATMKLIGSTDKLAWTSVEQDTLLQKGIATGETIVQQNDALRSYSNSQDDTRSTSNFAGYIASAADDQATQYGVIAVKDTSDFSAYGWLDGNSVESQIPHNLARNAAKEIDTKQTDQDRTFDTLPTQLPVTMANGLTTLRPVVIQPEKSVIGSLLSGAKYLRVAYKIEGTLLTGFYSILNYNQGTYVSELNRIAARNIAARPKTGTQPFVYQNQPVDIAKVSPSSTAPATDYTINGTNSLTKYIAANMIAGKEYIDMKAYIKADNHPGIYDAADEAVTENPYVVGVTNFHYYPAEGILEVGYEINSATREKMQKELANEVPTVIAKIIKPGMSAREKALAINNYLVDSAEYDDAAFNRAMKFERIPVSHTAFAILVDKTGVCDGYSKAFKILADAAGVESVVINGLTEGSIIGHSWNKVKMDGKWQVVDPTFNDSAEKNKYFGLTDAQANRNQFNTFVLDPFVNQYAAN